VNIGIAPLRSPNRREIHAVKTYFSLSLQPHDPCQSLMKKIYLFLFFRNYGFLAYVPCSQEGRFAIVTDVERGMRWVYRIAA